MLRAAIALCVGLAITFGPPIRGQEAPALTNSDIVKMVKAELPTSIILTTIETSPAKFDLSPAGLIALKEGGVDEQIIAAMLAKGRTFEARPEKSDALTTSKDREFILRNFKTVFVNASKAKYFDTPQMKGALGANRDFRALNVTIVDDASLADTVLDVNYTFAWDYPFSLVHQNTSMTLVSGKGTGPFSGPRGAASVAGELAKLLKPYRNTTPAKPSK